MFSEKQHASEEMLLRSSSVGLGDPSASRFPLNLIRQYSQIFSPRDVSSYYHLAMLSDSPTVANRRDECSDVRKNQTISARGKVSDSDDVREWARVPLYASAMNPSVRSSLSREFSSSHSANALLRRHRGEKKAIPEEQKDGKYFERRKRNNEAAKRSRDARKLREDRIAFRASILEQENAILKSQIFSLRDEITTLRQMILPRTHLTGTLPVNSN